MILNFLKFFQAIVNNNTPKEILKHAYFMMRIHTKCLKYTRTKKIYKNTVECNIYILQY